MVRIAQLANDSDCDRLSELPRIRVAMRCSTLMKNENVPKDVRDLLGATVEAPNLMLLF